MIKAAIFDMDGTITNTLPTIARVVNQVAHNRGMATFSEDELKYMVGNGYKNLLRLVFEKRAGNMTDLENAQKEYMKLYAEDYISGSYIYDGIRETLAHMKRANLKIGVLSNRPQEQTLVVINELFGECFFDLLCGAVDLYPLKPDTLQLENMLNVFKVEPSQTLYFGDTSTDMKTGKGAGLFTVGVLWGFRKKDELVEAGADAIIDKPSQMLDFLN